MSSSVVSLKTSAWNFSSLAATIARLVSTTTFFLLSPFYIIQQIKPVKLLVEVGEVRGVTAYTLEKRRAYSRFRLRFSSLLFLLQAINAEDGARGSNNSQSVKVRSNEQAQLFSTIVHSEAQHTSRWKESLQSKFSYALASLHSNY